MGFLSRYSGTDIIDLGDGYNVTLKRFLPGDTLEKADAARVEAVAEAQQGGDNKTVRVHTTTNVSAYTEILLGEAIVAWNLTDESDHTMPLEPLSAKLDSIRRLPASVRKMLREKVEENNEDSVRSPEEQKTFRAGGDLGSPLR